jgi:hypothetical protein
VATAATSTNAATSTVPAPPPGFHGPTGQPTIHGPSAPPPNY